SLGKAVMPDWVRGVDRLSQASQQADFQCAFLWSANDCLQETLHFAALREITHLDTIRPDLFPIVADPLRVRVLMNPVDRWNPPIPGFPGNHFVRQNHELLDMLVRNIILFTHQADSPSLAIQFYARLRHIEFKGPVIEPAFPEYRGKLPGTMDLLIHG